MALGLRKCWRESKHSNQETLSRTTRLDVLCLTPNLQLDSIRNVEKFPAMIEFDALDSRLDVHRLPRLDVHRLLAAFLPARLDVLRIPLLNGSVGCPPHPVGCPPHP